MDAIKPALKAKRKPSTPPVVPDAARSPQSAVANVDGSETVAVTQTQRDAMCELVDALAAQPMSVKKRAVDAIPVVLANLAQSACRPLEQPKQPWLTRDGRSIGHTITHVIDKKHHRLGFPPDGDGPQSDAERFFYLAGIHDSVMATPIGPQGSEIETMRYRLFVTKMQNWVVTHPREALDFVQTFVRSQIAVCNALRKCGDDRHFVICVDGDTTRLPPLDGYNDIWEILKVPGLIVFPAQLVKYAIPKGRDDKEADKIAKRMRRAILEMPDAAKDHFVRVELTKRVDGGFRYCPQQHGLDAYRAELKQ